MESKQTTIKDIARKLGISASTVSRALNDKFVKNEEMVALIKKTAEEMDYQTNTIAAGLRTRKSNLVGIVVPRLASSFFSVVLAQVQKVFNEKGYNVLICQSNESTELEQQQINSLVRCNVEGLLISCAESTKDEEFLDKIAGKGIKIVYYDRQNFHTEKPVVKVDDIKGGYIATNHLLDKGASNLVYVGGPEQLQIAQDRFEGFVQAMAERNTKPVKHFFCKSTAEVDEKLSKALKSKVDGVVCFSDEWAAQSILTLDKHKISVPKDALVTGYDNTSLCDLVKPGITSILHDATHMGEQAANTLLNLIEDKPVEKHVFLETKLIVRDSTKR